MHNCNNHNMQQQVIVIVIIVVLPWCNTSIGRFCLFASEILSIKCFMMGIIEYLHKMQNWWKPLEAFIIRLIDN